MKIKALRNFLVAGREYKIGEVFDIDDKNSRLLISMGKAKPADEVTPIPQVENREEELGERAIRRSRKSRTDDGGDA